MFWAALSAAFALLAILFLVFFGLVIWILVLECTKGTNGPNKYGEDPYGNGFKFSFEEDESIPGE
jgi:uncharacterized membrane protein YhaH (DUF805 family)